MILRIALFVAVLIVVLYLTAPHLLSAFRFYQGVRDRPETDRLTIKLVRAIFMMFFEIAYVATYLIVLAVLAAVLPDSTRDTWWYVVAVVLAFAAGVMPAAYALRDFWLSFTGVIEGQTSQQKDSFEEHQNYGR